MGMSKAWVNSRYTRKVTLEEGCIMLYNSLTEAVAVLEADEASAYKQLVSSRGKNGEAHHSLGNKQSLAEPDAAPSKLS